jgi:hypothetical protein
MTQWPDDPMTQWLNRLGMGSLGALVSWWFLVFSTLAGSVRLPLTLRLLSPAITWPHGSQGAFQEGDFSGRILCWDHNCPPGSNLQ